MTREHGWGSELVHALLGNWYNIVEPQVDSKPVTYTCVCGFRSTTYGDVARHISDENDLLNTPRRLTTIITIPTTGHAASEISIASTPLADHDDAIEIRMLVPDGRVGHYRQHTAIVRRSSIPFLIDELEAHRLDKKLISCAACAARAFVERLSADATQHKHSCSDQASVQGSDEPDACR